MVSLKKMPEKLIAVLLAFILVISTVPVSVFSVFAQQVDRFTVLLEDYNKTATVTLTQCDDLTVTETVDAENGKAVFENFYDDEKSYNIAVSGLIGYEDYFTTATAGNNPIRIPVSDLTEIETAVVSGVVTDKNGPVKNVSIIYTAYDGQLNNSVKTDTDGQYSFEVYKNIEYSVEINAGDKYEQQNRTVCVADNETIDISLDIIQFSINISVGENGAASDNNVFVDYGENAPSIFVRSDENYRIDKLTINNKSIDAAVGKEAYDISNDIKNVRENYVVSVAFYRPTYEITINYNKNGEVKDNSDNPVSSGGKVILQQGDSAGFNAVANENYHVSSVIIDDKSVSDGVFDNSQKNYSKTFNDNKAHTVTITFSINTFNVNAFTGENGSVSPDKAVVDYNEDAVISVTPNEGYDVEKFIVNGADKTDCLEESDIGYTYTITQLTEDYAVEAVFRKIENISVDNVLDNEYYTVTFSGAYVVNSDGEYVVADGTSMTIEPKAPYKKIRVASDDVFKKRGNSVAYNKTNNIHLIELSEGGIGYTKSSVVDIKFAVDSDAPVIGAFSKNPNVEYSNKPYTITLPVTDSRAGVKRVLYSTENDITKALEADYNADEKLAKFITVSEDFNGNYYIWAIDRVDNQSQCAIVDNIKIDTKDPQIDYFEFSCPSLNACEFGTFSNEDIVVTVTASDTQSKAESGVKEITFNGETKPAEGGAAVFILKTEDFNLTKEVSASVTDNAGNTTRDVVPSSTNSNVNSNRITISKLAADIDIQRDEAALHIDGDRNWYADNTDFKVNVKDTFGIKSVVIKMNNQEVVNEIYDTEADTVLSEEYIVNTVNNALDGENEITVEVVNVTNNPSKASASVFIDTTNPQITGFEFNKSESFKDKLLHILTFGKYSNDKVEITVNAVDNNASAGIKTISLYKKSVLQNDSEEEMIAAASFEESEITDNENINPSIIRNEDGTYSATFILPESVIGNEAEYFNALISAKAVDCVNNETESFTYVNTDNSPSFADSGLMIETIKPSIEVDYPSAAQNRNSATADSNDWYSTDIDFCIKASDDNSGIRSVTASINGKVLVDESKLYASETHEEIYTINTGADGVIIGKDGDYTLEIMVVDNAGNSQSYTKTIYKDTDIPSVVDFSFKAEGYDKDTVISGTSANKDKLSPQVKDYGYYFLTDTDVTVTANDIEPSSGIKSITYYTLDKDGGKSKEITKNVNDENQISFTVPANFKGQIYAKATDNVDNTASQFVNPDSTVIENEKQHKNSSYIKYTLKETKDINGNPIKDEKGNNLYSADTAVEVEIADTYSGIRQIDWEIIAEYDDKKQAGTVTVDNNGKVTSAAKDGYSADCLGQWKTTSENNLVIVLKNTITVSNNCNNIKLVFTLTDRAGNKTENVVQTLSIDKTAPMIAVQMNENDDNTYSGFFKSSRQADIYVYDRNFDSSDFVFDVIRTDDNGSKSNVSIKPAFSKAGEAVINGNACYVYKMSYTFDLDGDYIFKVSAEDFSEHKTSDNAVKYSSDRTTDYLKQNDADRGIDNVFTIDKTAPQVSVSYDNNSAQNNKYFNAYRTATIKVTEHNFASENNRITYTRTSARDGQTIETPAVSRWTHNGNVHTATIYYNADGDYTFGIDVMDMAGNVLSDSAVNYVNGREVSKSFTVDTTIAKPVIGGVANGQSYKDEVIPTIRIDDVNYASSEVQLLRTRKDEINLDVTKQYITNIPGNRAAVSEDNFEKIQENDGIYTLNVSVTDLAGNTASDSVTFTVNRFGSVYTFSNDLISLKDSYVKEVAGDVVITEYNPDRLVEGSLKVQITRDGAPISGVKYTVNPVANNSVAIGSSGWYQYDYVLDNANFDADGVYTITVSSEDTVGNKPQSANDSDLMFRVDSTPPEVVSVKGLENKIVNAADQKVEYQIMDAIGLKSIVVSVDNVAQEPITDFENISNYSGDFVVDEGLEHSVKIVITDLAGNVTDTSSDTFNPSFAFNNVITVSTNGFIRWYADKPLFIGSIAGAALAAGLIMFIIIKKKKNDDGNAEPES